MELAVSGRKEEIGPCKGYKALIIDWVMLTRQPTSILDLALEGAAVYLDVGKFIFPDSLSGFQESQWKWKNTVIESSCETTELLEPTEKRKSRNSGPLGCFNCG